MTLANSTMMGSHVILLTHGFTWIILVRIYFFILYKNYFNFEQIACVQFYQWFKSLWVISTFCYLPHLHVSAFFNFIRIIYFQDYWGKMLKNETYRSTVKNMPTVRPFLGKCCFEIYLSGLINLMCCSSF